jgi:hypothetical protein
MHPKSTWCVPPKEDEYDDENADDECQDARIFDTHTINAETGDMTETEVVHFCTLIRKTLADKFSISTRFKVNTITAYNKETKSRVAKGVSFIYWEKSEAYHILLGRNADGSDRVKIVYVNSDGDEVDPEKYSINDITEITDSTSSDDSSLSKSNNDAWDEGVSFLDTMDANGKKKRAIQEALAAGLIPPGYRAQKRNAAPLLPPFVYTRTNKTRAVMNSLDSSVNIIMHPFFVNTGGDSKANLDFNKLSGEVPKGTTVSELHGLFDIFSSHPNYPMISIKKVAVKPNGNITPSPETREIAFVVFHPRHTEARFARAFMLFTKFQIGKETTVKRFDHPWSRFRRDSEYKSY